MAFFIITKTKKITIKGVFYLFPLIFSTKMKNELYSRAKLHCQEMFNVKKFLFILTVQNTPLM